ncbi:MAG: hypothetical protein ACYCYN_06990 [Solirubrobacteraceae bacterium]
MLGATAATAMAEGKPTGAYSNFKYCPVNNPEVTDCVFSQTTSGEFVLGKERVPIRKTITLQGGLIVKKVRKAPNEETLVAATNGETLSKTGQNVPGGLSGLVDCQEIEGSGLLEDIERGTCESVFENGLTGVTATTELAGPASSVKISSYALQFKRGVALSMPVKIHLSNPLLGESCYVGSNSNPITLNLTSGTTSPPPPNSPITGSSGTLEVKEGGDLVLDTGNKLVENAWAAPAAEGCGGLLSFLIDPIIDSKIGLPSPAGHNTAILSGNLEKGYAEAVKKSEG